MRRIGQAFLDDPSSEESLAPGLPTARTEDFPGAVYAVRYGATVVVRLLFEKQDSNGRLDSY